MDSWKLWTAQALWNVASEWKIANRGGGLYGHPALSHPCACDLVGAIVTQVLFYRNSGASPSLAAPSLRPTEAVVYCTYELFPLGGKGKLGP